MVHLEMGCLDLCSRLLFTVLSCRVVTVSPATWLRRVNKGLPLSMEGNGMFAGSGRAVGH